MIKVRDELQVKIADTNGYYQLDYPIHSLIMLPYQAIKHSFTQEQSWSQWLYGDQPKDITKFDNDALRKFSLVAERIENKSIRHPSVIISGYDGCPILLESKMRYWGVIDGQTFILDDSLCKFDRINRDINYHIWQSRVSYGNLF
jgi:hypothetical protein